MSGSSRFDGSNSYRGIGDVGDLLIDAVVPRLGLPAVELPPISLEFLGRWKSRATEGGIPERVDRQGSHSAGTAFIFPRWAFA